MAIIIVPRLLQIICLKSSHAHFFTLFRKYLGFGRRKIDYGNFSAMFKRSIDITSLVQHCRGVYLKRSIDITYCRVVYLNICCQFLGIYPFSILRKGTSLIYFYWYLVNICLPQRNFTCLAMNVGTGVTHITVLI